MVLDMCGHCAEFEGEDIVDTNDWVKRQLIRSDLQFKDEHVKARLMTNLSELKNADGPFNQMRVQHDMTPSEGENEETLIHEGKERSAMDEDFST